MLIAFTDESYTNTRYLQAALIVREEDLGELERIVVEAKALARGFGVLGDIEMRGYSIMNAENGWSPLKNRFKTKKFCIAISFKKSHRYAQSFL